MNAKSGNICSIEDWCVVIDNYSPYMAPEATIGVIRGKVFGHPKFEDGSYIITGRIKKAQGRRLATDNNEYILGSIDPHYEAWCEEYNIELDHKNPIKLKQ